MMRVLTMVCLCSPENGCAGRPLSEAVFLIGAANGVFSSKRVSSKARNFPHFAIIRPARPAERSN
jgi:hypothetical protein